MFSYILLCLVADLEWNLLVVVVGFFLRVLGQLVWGCFFEAEFNMGISRVFVRRGKSRKVAWRQRVGGLSVPLTERVDFKTRL